MKIIVSGSLAYDKIMDFPGYFKDHILPDKVHLLNVSFAVNDLKEKFGGTAGNIAYNLSLFGIEPTILATAGKDFAQYRLWLDQNKIDTTKIKIIDSYLTASAYIITDKSDNQITGFYSGAMNYSHDTSIKDLNVDSRNSLVIISPSGKDGMLKHILECKDLRIPYIFDPAQQITALSKSELLNSIDGAKILIGNDYEIEMIANKTKLSREELLDKCEIVITTLGEKGSIIQTEVQTFNIPSAKPKKVLDPTGAGDAYRAGVIKGLVENKRLDEIGRIGSVCAVYAVETYGTQEHKFTKEEFEKRYKENYS